MMVRIVVLGLVIACGGTPERSRVTAPTTKPPEPPAIVTPVADPKPVDPVVADKPAPPSEWFVQVVEYGTSFIAPSLAVFARPGGIAILASVGTHGQAMWIRGNAKGWSYEVATPRQSVAATFDATGAPWLLAGAKHTDLQLEHGTIACAATLPVVVSKDPKAAPALRDVRVALEAACKTSRRSTACGALAYMKEAALGGAAQPAEALRHHLAACSLYSPASCVRLLVGPLGRPAPPKGLDRGQLTEALAEACSRRNDDGCLAYAAAHERGWVLARDLTRSRAILEEACADQRLEKVCKKLGKPVPKD